MEFIVPRLEIVFALAAVGLAITIVASYVIAIIKSKSTERAQAILMMIAFVASILIAISVNLILPLLNLQIDYIYFSPISSFIVISCIAYAISRHGLFDVRPFIARSITYVLLIAALFGIFLLVAFIALKSLFGSELQLNQTIFFAILSVFLALIFQPAKRYFDKITSRLFYRDAYDPQEVINKINSTLVNTIRLETLLKSTADIVESELNVTYADFYLDQRASIEFHLVGSNTKLFANPGWAVFADFFANSTDKVVLQTDEALPQDILANMRNLSIECAIKMTSSGEEVGFLLVGERKSGNSFTGQDIQLLEIIADEVAIAAQNALRFEEISKFNITLQKKIDDATKELQKTNEKLKALDEAKDEFISMASHQLRTPLTSVKGYISMILEGDAGDINETQHKFLDQAFVSSQRMVYLIADLLNVSRLKTGKFIIESKPTYLPDVVESEISQLYETAKVRELQMLFDKPKDYPILNLDETKIRQVIMNFVDNAIYYTPRGGRIKIALTKTKDSVEFTVTDTGIGVPKSEQHHLFTKFYRAGNAKSARPDGTGLGLFMAKKVVIAQGGAIIFITKEGKGSTFGFSFPLSKLEVSK